MSLAIGNLLMFLLAFYGPSPGTFIVGFAYTIFSAETIAKNTDREIVWPTI